MWQGIVGAKWFIAAENGGWFAARPMQVEAIETFLSQDRDQMIRVSDGTFYRFRYIGSGQSDRRYAIQDRNKNGVYREIARLDPGFVGS